MRDIEAFLAARDLLLRHRADYETAYREFRWPRLETFNWALDHFDRLADGNDSTALWIVDASGGESRTSFAELARRSNRVANYLRASGVSRGDRVLLMLDNVAPLWETMLALIKLGAVLIPSTPLLATDDIADRLERGQVKHIVAGADKADRFGELGRDCTRIAVGGTPADGWRDYAEVDEASDAFEPDGETRADDLLLLYFTSGTTARPKLVEHTHVSYPVGHLSTMYWLGLEQGDIHLNISSPGWAGPSTPGAASSRRGTPGRRCSSTPSRDSMRRRPCRRSSAAV